MSTRPIAPSPGDPDVAAEFVANEQVGFRPTAARGPLPQGCSVILCTYARPDAAGRFLESLRRQRRPPDELLVIDASADSETEAVVRRHVAEPGGAYRTAYHRVTGRHRGLTRQRNFALERVRCDVVAFFDDDTILDESCLGELERTLRADGGIVGVGGRVDESGPAQERLWRLRSALRIVGDLTPGRYCRSGMSIPWSFLSPGGNAVEGDWLPGCAMAWRTDAAREVRFYDGFAGYAQGEDLDFSLRMRCHGRLVLAPAARLSHLHEPNGRPDDFRLGYMAIRNRYEIHRRGLPQRTAWDVAWFAYAWTLDTLMLARHLARPDRRRSTVRHIGGRVRAAFDLACRRGAASAARVPAS